MANLSGKFSSAKEITNRSEGDFCLERVCSQRSYDPMPTYPQKENWEIRAFVVAPKSMGGKFVLCLVQSPRLKLK